MSPKQDVTDQLNAEMKAAARNTIWTTGCNSWYLDKNGDPISWPWSGRQYRKHLKELRLDEYVDESSEPNATQPTPSEEPATAH